MSAAGGMKQFSSVAEAKGALLKVIDELAVKKDDLAKLVESCGDNTAEAVNKLMPELQQLLSEELKAYGFPPGAQGIMFGFMAFRSVIAQASASGDPVQMADARALQTGMDMFQQALAGTFPSNDKIKEVKLLLAAA